ncbi:hypothetical protein CRUP_009346 [Coryphaenoides rupestris]|nr:hypothetical protein CRUP_009346 [Coryphaenoides rupestris]
MNVVFWVQQLSPLQLAKKIREKFNRYLDVVNRNKQVVEASYTAHLTSPLTAIQDCCSIPASMMDCLSGVPGGEVGGAGGGQVVHRLAKKIREKFNRYLDVVNRNKQVVEASYTAHLTSPLTAIQDCCSIPASMMDFDGNFNTNVSKTICCDRLSPTVNSRAFNPGRDLNSEADSLGVNKAHSGPGGEPPPYDHPHPTTTPNTAPTNPTTTTPTLRPPPYGPPPYDHHHHPTTTTTTTLRPPPPPPPYDHPHHPTTTTTTLRPPPPYYHHPTTPPTTPTTAAVKLSKHLVVMLDHGASVTDTQLQIARDSALVILNAVDEHDKISVLSVADGVRSCSLDQCYRSLLSPATSETKRKMSSFVAGVKASDGATQHAAGFQKAFQLLRNTTATMGRHAPTTDMVILYLSSGVTTRETSEQEKRATLSVIREENRYLNNSVMILTYALMNEGVTGLKELAFLRDLAEQNSVKYGVDRGGADRWDRDQRSSSSSSSALPVVKGSMMVLNQLSNLETSVGRFYINLPNRMIDLARFSLPYADPMGDGFIMTVSRPCYFGNLLLGVVGVDVNLAYILEDVTYYQDSLASYTFLIDDKGHPPTRLHTHTVYTHVYDKMV